jgi:hypothetical protein
MTQIVHEDDSHRERVAISPDVTGQAFNIESHLAGDSGVSRRAIGRRRRRG